MTQTPKMTDEQTMAMVEQVLATQDVASEYPIVDGRRDFSGDPVARPLSREDVEFLVNLYCQHRNNGADHAEAVRVTIDCCYRKTDIQFNPHARVAALRNVQ